MIRMMPMMRKMSTLTCPGVLPATLSLQVLLQPHVLLIAMIRIIMIINDDYQDESARELLREAPFNLSPPPCPVLELYHPAILDGGQFLI